MVTNYSRARTQPNVADHSKLLHPSFIAPKGATWAISPSTLARDRDAFFPFLLVIESVMRRLWIETDSESCEKNQIA
uniref:Uncharacterized protein n=1 Tax=Romanomermis culicivorax TaxID=13658 RepID=A0A915KQ84_ROMCU